MQFREKADKLISNVQEGLLEEEGWGEFAGREQEDGYSCRGEYGWCHCEKGPCSCLSLSVPTTWLRACT